MKKQTQEELERENYKLRYLLAICVFVALAFVISYVIMGIVNESRFHKQESQLSECQVRDCYFKDGFWGFRTVCEDDIFGQENKGTVVSHYFHKHYNTCWGGLVYYMSNKENCEVLKEVVESNVTFLPH